MKKYFLLIIIIGTLFTSCYYDNYIELNPGADLDLNCDTSKSSITFSKSIKPIFITYCGATNSCHGPTSNNPHLSTYEGARVVAADGRLINSVNHIDPNKSSFMPKNSNTILKRCARKKIELWVDSLNYPDN